MLVGQGTQEDLTGARLYVGDLGASGLEEGGLRLDSLANMLLTVQLHDFMTDLNVCLAAIPLVSETGHSTVSETQLRSSETGRLKRE